MDKKIKDQAALYFEQYPRADELFTTGDGTFFLKSNLSAAKTYANKNGKKLLEIGRDEVTIPKKEKKPTPDTPAGSKNTSATFPEGEPEKDGWTKPQIIAYSKDNYPDLKLTMNMKEDTLLDKIKEAKEAAQGGTKQEGT